jgi:hypothetical protein
VLQSKRDGQGNKTNPWHCVEKAPASAPEAAREVGVEFVQYDDPMENFVGKVVALPTGYAGALKKGDSVFFDAAHIND